MRNVFVLLTLAVILLPNNDAAKRASYGDNLLRKLDKEIHRINDLITQIQEHYREEDRRHSRKPLPRNYETTLRRASTTISRALGLMKDIDEKINRRSNDTVHEGNARNETKHEAKEERKKKPKKSTRRSQQSDLPFDLEPFYKAVSRATKKQFKDNPIIRDNIHDGFVPPTHLEKSDQKSNKPS